MDEREVDAALRALGVAGATARDMESQTLDFKAWSGNFKQMAGLLADAVVCLVNAHGGHVVVGVDDRAAERRAALPGVPQDVNVEALRRAVYDRTRPAITAFVSERVVDGVRIVVMTVPPGVQPHSNSAGLATRRQGKDCLPFPPDEQREWRIARGQLDWSADRSSVGLDDLDPGEVQRVRRLLVGAGREQTASLDLSRMLTDLRLLAPDGSVVNAGVLLLATEKALRTVVPAYGYGYQYRPSPGSEATSRFRETRSLLAGVEVLVDAIERLRQVHPLSMAAGVQIQLTDYPREAVRELVVNAFLHRSYETNGTVEVEHSPERLIVVSPGGLVPGVTPENILTVSPTPRNRLLAEVVATLQVAERTGQGVDRAYREMLRVGKEPPVFIDDLTSVRAQLPGGIGNDAFVRYLSDLPESLSRDVDALLTLSLLRKRSSVDANVLAKVIQRTPAEAQVDCLARLADEHKLLEPTRRTVRNPFPSYRLRSETLAAMARAVSCRRRSVDDIDTKVIEHVREYGSVSNRTIQRTFDLHVFAARDLITDLRARDILVKIGDARGGSNVRYGPGSKFPKV